MIFGVMMAIKKGKVLFVSKEKSQNLYRQLELQLPQGFYRLGFDNIIRQSQAVVNPWSMPEGFEPRFCAEMAIVGGLLSAKPCAIPAGLRGFEYHSVNEKRECHQTVTLSFLARPEGFEPPAFGIGIHCDIQLRHGRICGCCSLSNTHCTPQIPSWQEENCNFLSILLRWEAQPQCHGGDVVGVVALGGDGGVHHRLRQRLHTLFIVMGG